MIKTTNITIPNTGDLDNTRIEEILTEKGYNLIRWAIIESTKEFITLTVSYIE